MKNHIATYILITAASVSTLFAQTTDENTLSGEDIVIVKDYEARIDDAQRLKVSPSPLAQEYTKLDVEYDVPSRLLELDYPAHTLRPMVMPKLKTEKLRHSYLRLGFGTQFSPLAEIGYNDKKENFQYGAFYKHLSAYGQKIKNQSFRDNEAGIYGQYFLGKVELGADVNFSQNVDYFYGYNHADFDFEKDEIKQRVREIGASIYLKDGQVNDKTVKFDQQLSFSSMKDAYDVKEWNINYKSDVSKTFKDKHIVHVGGMFDAYNYIPTDRGDIEREIFQIGADYIFTNDDFKLTAGLVTAFGDVTEDGKVNLYPKIHTEKKLFQNYLIFYSSWSRRLQQNTYNNFVNENPYININPLLKNARVEDRIAGFKGTVNKVTYNVKFSNKVIKEMALYVNDTLDMKRFDIVYDKNMTVINLNAEMGYAWNKKINTIVGFDFMLYEPDEQEKAWHMPAFKTNVITTYNLKDKFLLRAELFSLAGAFARNENGDAEKIKGMIDINLGAEYQFSNYLSFFAQLNNLANFKYQKFHRYPTYGFNGMVGAQLRF